MPTITQGPVTAWAHCVHARCTGHQQQEVQAVRTEDSYTYAEQGGDLPGIERSFVRLTFADEAESTCGHCGGDRELSESPRRRYQNLSGYAQDGLLDVEPFDPAKTGAPDVVAERDQLREEVAELRGMMTVFMAGQQSQEAAATDPEQWLPEQPPAPETVE